MKGINELAQQAHKNNIDKGFYDHEKNIGEMLCLIHSEVSEALEADRKEKYTNNDLFIEAHRLNELDDKSFKQHFERGVKDTFQDELADIVIRVMDMTAYMSIDLESHILAKLRYNSLREHKHGKKY